MFYIRTPVCRIKHITRFYLKHIDMSNKCLLLRRVYPYFIYSVVYRCYFNNVQYHLYISQFSVGNGLYYMINRGHDRNAWDISQMES